MLVGVRGGPPELSATVLGDHLEPTSLRWPGRPYSVQLTSSGTGGRAHSVPYRPPGPTALRQLLSVVQALPRRPRRVGVAVPPTSGHGWGAINAAWWLGGAVVDLHRVPPSDARALLHDSATDTITALPQQLPHLLTPTVTLAISGSDRLDPQLCNELLDQVPLVNVYGTTETGPVTVATPEDLARVPGCVGRPLAGVSLQVEPDGAVAVRTALSHGRIHRSDRGEWVGDLLMIHGRIDGRPTRRGEIPDTRRAERAASCLDGVVTVESAWTGRRWTMHLITAPTAPPTLTSAYVRAFLVAQLGPRDCPDEVTID